MPRNHSWVVVAVALALTMLSAGAVAAQIGGGGGAPGAYNAQKQSSTAASANVDHICVVPVASSALNIEVGKKTQFLASAYDAGNANIPGCLFAWSVSPAGSFAIDSAMGAFVNVTAIDYGTGTLTAQYLGVSGSAAISAPAPDGAAPAIWHEAPYTQTSNHSVLIKAKVTDNSAIRSVVVMYRAGPGAFKAAQMSPLQSDPEEYRALLQLPKSFRGILEYYIEAQDAYGNAATMPPGNGAARLSIEITTEPALYEQPGFWFGLLAIAAIASTVGILAARQRRRAGKKRRQKGAAMGPSGMSKTAPKKGSDYKGSGNTAADARVQAKNPAPQRGAKGKQ